MVELDFIKRLSDEVERDCGCWSVNGCVGYVAQQTCFLNGIVCVIPLISESNTMKDNIEEMWECKVLNNVLGEWEQDICDGAWNMSGGERQFTCAVYALLSHSFIISMDKTTAFMDVQTDCLIHKVFGS